MKHLTNLRAHRLIIHITNLEQDIESFRPSTAETPLDGVTREYIQKHLQDTLIASPTYSARFTNPAAEEPAVLCRRMINSEAAFLDGSARLARRYLAVVAGTTRGKGNIAQGNIAFVACEGTEDLGELGQRQHQLLVLMKLDLGDAFVSTFDETTGATVLQQQRGAMPTEKEGLQKCVFIAHERWGGEEGYDMMMLDRQSAGGADFWQKSFLSALPALDNTQRWRAFKKETGAVLNKMKERGDISDEEHRTLMEQRYDVLDTFHTNAIEWARTRQLSEENKGTLESTLLRKLDSPEFQPPQDAKEKDFLVYKGDGNLSLKIPQSMRHRISEPEIVKDEAGNDVYRIVIETSQWKVK